jgi:hypothetical protein
MYVWILFMIVANIYNIFLVSCTHVSALSEFQMGQVQWAGPSTVLKSTAQERPGPYSIVPGPGPAHH